MLQAILLALLGLVLSYVGAVSAAGMFLRSGLRAGWSVMAISLVLLPIAFGLPFLAAVAALSVMGIGELGLALCTGAVVGSVLLGLGLLAFHVRIELRQRVLWQEWLLLALAGGMLWLAGIDGEYTRVDGQFLLTLAAVRVWLLSEASKTIFLPAPACWPAAERPKYTTYRGLALAGLLALVGGGAVGVALGRAHHMWQPIPLGSGDLVVVLALGVVGLGLALPMLSYVFEAGSRAGYDQALAVLVGTFSFCWLLVLPIALIIWPMPAAPGLWWFDQPAMLAVLLALLPMVRAGKGLGRAEGVLLVAGGVVYLGWGMITALF